MACKSGFNVTEWSPDTSEITPVKAFSHESGRNTSDDVACILHNVTKLKG